MDKSVRDRRHTAVHEAGHAVIGRVLKMPCGHATVVKQGDALGLAIVGFDPSTTCLYWLDEHGKWREEPVALRASMIASMAGAEAERVLLGTCLGGDGSDQLQIATKASELWDTYSPECERWYARLGRQTARLVRNHRREIERVADALLARKTLQAHEIDELLGPHTPDQNRVPRAQPRRRQSARTPRGG